MKRVSELRSQYPNVLISDLGYANRVSSVIPFISLKIVPDGLPLKNHPGILVFRKPALITDILKKQQEVPVYSEK